MLRTVFSRAAPGHALAATTAAHMAALPSKEANRKSSGEDYYANPTATATAMPVSLSLAATTSQADHGAAPSPPTTAPAQAAITTTGHAPSSSPAPSERHSPNTSTRQASVMTKAKRIRLAAAAAAAQRLYKDSGSPLSFSLLGQQLKTLRDEEKLLTASLQRLKAERQLAVTREAFETVKDTFAAGMLAREAAALEQTHPHPHQQPYLEGNDQSGGGEKAEAEQEEEVRPASREAGGDGGAYQVEALSAGRADARDGTDRRHGAGGRQSGANEAVTDGGMPSADVHSLHEEILTAAVAGELLGLPATADAQAAAAEAGTHKRRDSRKKGHRPLEKAATAKAPATSLAPPAKKRVKAAAAAAAAAARSKPKPKTSKGSSPAAATKLKATRTRSAKQQQKQKQKQKQHKPTAAKTGAKGRPRRSVKVARKTSTRSSSAATAATKAAKKKPRTSPMPRARAAKLPPKATRKTTTSGNRHKKK